MMTGTATILTVREIGASIAYYRDALGYPQDAYPATEEYYWSAISLPMFPEMTE